MVEYLEDLRQQKHPQKQEMKLRKVKRPPLFKNINLEMQSFIVCLRYGSLKEPGDIKMSFKAISEITKVHPSAINNVCRRWIANGYQIINMNKLGTNKRTKLTPEIVAFMINPKTLYDWASYSLRQRTIMIEQKYGITVHHSSIERVYKDQKGITQLPVIPQMVSGLTIPQRP